MTTISIEADTGVGDRLLRHSLPFLGVGWLLAELHLSWSHDVADECLQEVRLHDYVGV